MEGIARLVAESLARHGLLSEFPPQPEPTPSPVVQAMEHAPSQAKPREKVQPPVALPAGF